MHWQNQTPSKVPDSPPCLKLSQIQLFTSTPPHSDLNIQKKMIIMDLSINLPKQTFKRLIKLRGTDYQNYANNIITKKKTIFQVLIWDKNISNTLWMAILMAYKARNQNQKKMILICRIKLILNWRIRVKTYRGISSQYPIFGLLILTQNSWMKGSLSPITALKAHLVRSNL